jgi:hypothetical protein
MKESIKNWIDFFRDISLGKEDSEKVFNFISHYTSGSLISIVDIMVSLNVNRETAILIINALLTHELIKFKNQCPSCDNDLDNDILNSFSEIYHCDKCLYEFSINDLSAFEILDKATNNIEINNYIKNITYNDDAKEFISIGIKNKHIFYLITDIEGSQKLQRIDVGKYNYYLNYLRKNVWPNAIRKSLKRKIIMFGRGDCIVYAFVNIKDLINVIFSLRDQIIEIEDLRLSAHVIQLNLSEEDKNYFSVNMEGLWDLNTVAVTDAYRLAAFKPENWADKETTTYKIKIAFIGEAYLNNHEIITNQIDGKLENFQFDPKHGIEYNEVCYSAVI